MLSVIPIVSASCLDVILYSHLLAFTLHVSVPYSKMGSNTAQYTFSVDGHVQLLVPEDGWS